MSDVSALTILEEVRGLRYAVLIDAQGNVEGHVGAEVPDPSVAATARAMLGSLQTAMGAHGWNDLLLDLEGGPILLTQLGDQILQVAFDDIASLGRVRFSVKRTAATLQA